MKCDRCGRDNPDDLRFCQDCGNRLSAPRVEATPPRGVALGGEAGVRARPPAPEFDFSPKMESDGVTCGRCGTVNPPGSRFCPECGNNLAEPPPPVAAAPVVNLASGPVAPVGPIVCTRCRGKNEPGMTYCQYCGARLDTAEAAERPYREPQETRPESPVARMPSAPPPRPEPPPPAASHARFIVIAQDGSPGRQYPLSDDQTDVGREEGDIQLPGDPYVSPRHARVTRRNGQYFVRDLGSTNGVFVRLRGSETLHDGDLVLVGLEVLRFEVVNDAEKGFGPAVELGTQVFGSPATGRHARLCQRTIEGVTRDVYYLSRDETVIGRESGDLVFTGDPFMSRRHATLVRDTATGVFSLKDLGSSNGTYLRIRGEHPLTDGDHVRVGQHLFRLELGGQG